MVTPVTAPEQTDQEVDENPAQSIKQILEQRMIQIDPQPESTVIVSGVHPYRRAIVNGVLAALLVVLLVGTLFVIKSLE